MAITDLKFAEGDFTNEDIASLPDRPGSIGMTAAQLKARFDNVGKALIALGNFNDLIDALVATTDGNSGADNIAITNIAGITATTIQSALEALKAYVDYIALEAGAVTSVFGRAADVTAQSGDYTAAQVGALPITGGTLTGGITAPSFNQTPDSYGVNPLEIGKYIDFHDVGSVADYDVRLAIINGFAELGNPNVATTGKSQYGRILTQPAIIFQATSLLLDLSHAESRIFCTNGSGTDITITVPANSTAEFPVGASIDFIAWGGGEVVFVHADGVELQSISSYRSILSIYAAVSLIKLATDNWVLIGALKA